MSENIYLSVIVPCYNEEQGIAALYERLSAAVAPYAAQGVEIILVDDGSRDRSWAAIEQICTRDPRVAGIKLSRNFGHQFALACGLDHAHGERILVIDADLQDPPELLSEMMEKIDQGADVVYGQREARHGESIFKRASAWLFYRVLGFLSDVPIPPDTGDFRLMHRRVVLSLSALPERVRFTRGMVSWLGFRQVALPYVRAARKTGKSNYSLGQMLRLAGAGLASFSTRPLRLAAWLGALLLIAAFLLAIYAAGAHSTLMALIAGFLVFQGITWILLGMIGGYVGVIVREAKGRPLYLIDQKRNI